MTNKQFHHNMTNLEIYDKLNELFEQIQTLQQTVDALSERIQTLEDNVPRVTVSNAVDKPSETKE